MDGQSDCYQARDSRGQRVNQADVPTTLLRSDDVLERTASSTMPVVGIGTDEVDVSADQPLFGYGQRRGQEPRVACRIFNACAALDRTRRRSEARRRLFHILAEIWTGAEAPKQTVRHGLIISISVRRRLWLFCVKFSHGDARAA